MCFHPYAIDYNLSSLFISHTFELKNWKLAKKERCLQFFPSINIPTHAFENLIKVTHTSCIPFTCWHKSKFLLPLCTHSHSKSHIWHSCSQYMPDKNIKLSHCKFSMKCSWACLPSSKWNYNNTCIENTINTFQNSIIHIANEMGYYIYGLHGKAWKLSEYTQRYISMQDNS